MSEPELEAMALRVTEGEKSIDEAWLEPLCQRVSEMRTRWYITDDLSLVKHPDGWRLKWKCETLIEQANRGHVVDAMRLFGIRKDAR